MNLAAALSRPALRAHWPYYIWRIKCLDLKKFPIFLMADIVSDLQIKLSDRPSSGTATLSGDANGLLLLDQMKDDQTALFANPRQCLPSKKMGFF